ncbi:MAG: hypothetical protein QXJ21_06230 [Thermofilum sp.]
MVPGAALRKRFLELLRQASPRRRDSIIAVTVNNPQSYLALKTLIHIEDEFESTILHLHVGDSISPRLAELSQMCKQRVQVPESPKSITELKLQTASFAARYGSPLCVLPLTAEEVVAYLLNELLMGNPAGLQLEREYRTAYPLSTTTLKEVLLLVGVEDSENPNLLLEGPAVQLLEALKGRADPPAASRLYVHFTRQMLSRERSASQNKKDIFLHGSGWGR